MYKKLYHDNTVDELVSFSHDLNKMHRDMSQNIVPLKNELIPVPSITQQLQEHAGGSFGRNSL